MATDVQPDAKAAPADPGRRPYRFTAEQFWKMIEAGVFPESHFELVRGRIYLTTKHEPHNFTVRRTVKLLRAMTPAGFYVRPEASLRHDRWSVPEPDVAVVPGDEDIFQPEPPLTSEAVLIVEVCASTPWSDYRQKAGLYASAGVPTYWIVDVVGRKIDVFTKPRGAGREAAYAEHHAFAEGAPAPVVLDGREVGRVDAKDLLPPIEEPPKPTSPTA
ncbi:Uma2 family endonuclease [Paludisphaera sp.]|uniref:Uma2 family endonuclease n=1 Tax=Paludisphaera sp. TaxID=2017432 RepID=UPI00301D4B37